MFEHKNKILRILILCIYSSIHSGNLAVDKALLISPLSCSSTRICALITSPHWPKNHFLHEIQILIYLKVNQRESYVCHQFLEFFIAEGVECFISA